MKKIFRKEKGSIGIGSLIIFVALMVVAAIAAAVIVGTVSSLRDKAYGAANSANNMINGNIWNAQFIGYRNNITSNITKMEISFSVVSDSIDLNQTIIEYSSNNTPPVYFRLNWTDVTSAYGLMFAANVTAFNGNTESWDPANGKYYASPGELVVLTLDLRNMPLHQGQKALITIIPKPGAPYQHTIIAPADFGTALAIEL